MAYSLKIRTEVINHVHQGMTVLDVSQMYNISRHTVANWIKDSDKYLNETRTAHKPFDMTEEEIADAFEACRTSGFYRSDN